MLRVASLQGAVLAEIEVPADRASESTTTADLKKPKKISEFAL